MRLGLLPGAGSSFCCTALAARSNTASTPVSSCPHRGPPVPPSGQRCHSTTAHLAVWQGPQFHAYWEVSQLDCCWSLSAPACLVPTGLHHKQLVSSINQWPDPAKTTSSGAVAWPLASLSSCICSPRQHLAWSLGHSFPHRQTPGWPRLGVHSQEAVCPAHGQVVTLPRAGSTGGLPLLEPLYHGGVLLSCSRTGASWLVGYALLFCECIHIIQLKGNLDEFANLILALLRSNASVTVRHFGTTRCHCHSKSS